MTTAISLAVIGITVSPLPAQADWWSRNVAPLGPAIEQGAHDTGNAIEKGAHDTGNAVEKGAHDTGNAVEKGAHDTGNAIEKGAHDTGNAVEKGAHDTGKTIEKAVQDTGKAGETVYTFGVREIQGIGDSVRDADKRLKEGKFVDTI